MKRETVERMHIRTVLQVPQACDAVGEHIAEKLAQRRFLRTQYKALELGLYRALAVFGPVVSSPLDKWRLSERSVGASACVCE